MRSLSAKVLLTSITLLNILGGAGCASSHYRVTKTDQELVEISVTSDRLAFECLDLNYSDDHAGFRMFAAYVIDEKNTVMELWHSNSTSAEGCDHRKRLAEKVTHTGKAIALAARGHPFETPSPDRTNPPQFYEFPGRGRLLLNGRFMTFVRIVNENDVCYGALTDDKDHCFDPSFPIKGPGDPLPAEARK